MIEYVKDRPGHDFRYSLDCSKLMALGWRPEYSFEEALESTVKWYTAKQVVVGEIKTLIIGAGGMLGKDLSTFFPDAVKLTHSELDITDEAQGSTLL